MGFLVADTAVCDYQAEIMCGTSLLCIATHHNSSFKRLGPLYKENS